MITIYGMDLSTFTNAVRFTANYLDVDYQYQRVNLMEGEGQTEAYRQVSPAGKIPGLDDNGFKVFESSAIQRYLAVKENSSLFPEDLREGTKVEMWQTFVHNHIITAVNKVVFNKVFYQMTDIPKDERSLADGINFLQRFLPIVDKELEKQKILSKRRN